MLLTEFLKEGVASLEGLYPTAEARSIMLMLCESRLGTKSYTYILEPHYEIADGNVRLLREDLERLRGGEPIQYVIGRTEFCGLPLRVNRDVLIPRPETELLVHEAIKIASRLQRMRGAYGRNAQPVRVLDLCTGSGCIAWTVALKVPGVRVLGIDVSQPALDVARSQEFGGELKQSGAVAPEFMQADLFDDVDFDSLGTFDIILSNPPYIMEREKPQLRSNVIDYEPHIALFVPDGDPLVFYREIVRWSDRLMAEDGRGLTEINELLSGETQLLFKRSGYGESVVVKDFYDRNRFVYYSR